MVLKGTKQLSPNRYELTIEIDKDTFVKAVDRVYKREKNKIRIPGFRKGKAPKSFIEKYYGAEVFKNPAIEDIYPEALESAIKEASLEYVQDKIDLDIVHADETGLEFKAAITTKPEVEIDGYKGIEIKAISTEVTEEDVEKELENQRIKNGRYVSVENDVPAKNGDIVVIDFDGTIDGQRSKGMKSENYNVRLGSGQFVKGFEEQIVGHKAGEVFDIAIVFEDSYVKENNLPGKSAVFNIKLHEIKSLELPELDDDFAKDVSSFDTLEEYKNDLKLSIKSEKEKASERDSEEQIIDYLVKEVKCDIPQAMYENELKNQIDIYKKNVSARGIDFEVYKKQMNITENDMRTHMMPMVERRVKSDLAIEKISKLENIEASKEELEEEFNKVAEQYKLSIDVIKKNDYITQEIEHNLKMRKTFDFLIDNAKLIK